MSASLNVLVLGGGGREHALVWAVKRSPRVKSVFCAPGNAGIAKDATCVELNLKDPSAVLAFLKDKSIDLTVVGPEAPLVDGLADAIRAAGRRVFGVGKSAARLEGSKAFAKDFMSRHNLPTAEYKTFSRAEDALEHVKSTDYRPNFRVVKASGLAAGKGVAVCKSVDEVITALEDAMIKRVFGAAGDQVVLEETLEGEELSVIALCDGESLKPLLPTQDHKRALDGDEGPNTGGMGAYGPVPQVTDAVWRQIEERVYAPFLKGLKADGIDYQGVIYFGIMMTRQGPKLLEFNVRFGDPETQVILPMIESDWVDLFDAVVDRRLAQTQVKRRAGAGVIVVMAAEGYPGEYRKNAEISGLEDAARLPDVTVFHAGTALKDGRVITTGGRVLGVVALGADLMDARRRAYEAADKIRFQGAHFRRDVGAKGLRALSA
jgi:phosphoribosylamine--glycine ligase